MFSKASHSVSNLPNRKISPAGHPSALPLFSFAVFQDKTFEPGQRSTAFPGNLHIGP